MKKQAIAGVSPQTVGETTIQTVWPSHAMHWFAYFLGENVYSIEWPGVYIFRLGNLLAFLSIPLILPIFFYYLLPIVAIRYRLTNRRVMVMRGMIAEEERSIALDAFDRIDIDVKPGYVWYGVGDLVFYRGNVECFRLEAVSQPETFRHTCLKAHQGFVGVQKAEAAGCA